eukprot:307864-Amphidinium_carterae.1
MRRKHATLPFWIVGNSVLLAMLECHCGGRRKIRDINVVFDQLDDLYRQACGEAMHIVRDALEWLASPSGGNLRHSTEALWSQSSLPCYLSLALV